MRRPARFRHALILALLLAAAAPGLARADSDHDRARRALEAGEVVPLAEVLAAVERDFVGRVIAVELERKNGAWIYEIKLLTGDGALLRLDYDARTRMLVRARGRGVDAARRR